MYFFIKKIVKIIKKETYLFPVKDSFFNKEGIIKFGNVDEFIYIANNLDENYYNSRKDIIEENYQKALQYVNYEQNIVNKIIKIFKHNNLI